MKNHLVNCTYCIYRTVTPGDRKRSIPEMERCKISGHLIKSPREAGRFCKHFHQEGHDCECCAIGL